MTLERNHQKSFLKMFRICYVKMVVKQSNFNIFNNMSSIGVKNINKFKKIIIYNNYKVSLF